MNKIKHGTFVDYNKSNFFTNEKQFKYQNIIPLMGNGLTNLVNLTALTYAYKYAMIAGINQGVILTLNSVAVLYNVIIFYLLFKEKVNAIQLTGIAFMLSCVALLSINGTTKESDNVDGVDKRYYAFLSIACGLISPMALSTKHIVIRSYKKSYNTWDMAIDGLILEYVLYVVLAFQSFVISHSQFSFYNLLIGFFASCFLIIGKISIALAVSSGIAGPAASLANTQTIYATLLTTFVSQQPLNSFEISGLLCGITGATVISMGEIIITRIKSMF